MKQKTQEISIISRIADITITDLLIALTTKRNCIPIWEVVQIGKLGKAPETVRCQ